MRFALIPILLLVLQTCTTHQVPVESENIKYRISRSIESDTTHIVSSLIKPYKDSLDLQMNEIIGINTESISKRKPESKLGNWIADALQGYASKTNEKAVDASIQNYGGIRIPELAEGPITLGKVYEIMPFDNLLVIVEMQGSTLQQLFNQMAADGGWPISKEAQYRIIDNKATDIRIANQAIVSNQMYRIAMPDYIANGNGGCDFLSPLKRANSGVLIRDILAQQIKELHKKGLPVESRITGRVL